MTIIDIMNGVPVFAIGAQLPDGSRVTDDAAAGNQRASITAVAHPIWDTE